MNADANVVNNTKDLRKILRQKRKALTAATQQQHSQLIVQHIANSNIFQNAKIIAAYLAFDGEVDIKPLINLAWTYNKTVSLPIVPKSNSQPLTFAIFEADTPTHCDRFGIESPDLSHSSSIEAHQFDMVLTPLVGFDMTGTRMGMGAGFYDRTFASHNTQLVGIAHQCQQVEQLTRNVWDIPLNYLATELKMTHFNN